MIVTEKEAKGKWCPLKRGRGLYNGLVNIAVECEASGCMMWRVETPNTKLDEATGYCGLAGRPKI